MKKLFIIVIVFAGLSVLPGNAQNLKFGHINSMDIFEVMPERDSALSQLQQYQEMLQEEFQTMQIELTNKYQQFEKNKANYSQIVRQNRENELNEMQRRIQEFDATAQQDLSAKQQELIEPIMTRIRDAIEKVGKENGFIYIFDAGQGSNILYKSSQSVDVTNLVKAKLGIQ